MNLFDTHCHIHEIITAQQNANATHGLWLKGSVTDAVGVIAQAAQNGVQGMICVGTTADDSELAVQFVEGRPNCWASIGIHPHEAKEGKAALERLAALLIDRPLPSLHTSPSQISLADKESASDAGKANLREGGIATTATKPEAIQPLRKIVAIGECGLDYFYSHSPKEDQIKALRFQIELALRHNLPLIFHVREAFDDFWQILADYEGVRGVVHSFTDTQENLEKIIEKGLFVGLNGIITFTKNGWQLEVAKNVPRENLVLETDAPFLTPAPIRGKVNTPANVRLVAEFLAELRGDDLEILARATTHNAFALFGLK